MMNQSCVTCFGFPFFTEVRFVSLLLYLQERVAYFMCSATKYCTSKKMEKQWLQRRIF